MTQPRKHRHAEMIKRWLDDDSLEVEHRNCDAWSNVTGNPIWSEQVEYRFKPRMIKCGELAFPEPMRVAPEIGTEYWKPNLDTHGIGYAVLSIWHGMPASITNLRQGFCHTTQAAAEQHAKALIALTESKS